MFNDELRKRSFEFSKSVILNLRCLSNNEEIKIIRNQLIRSSTSVGSNFRASCVSRSRNEWFAKMCIVVEEADETCYWLDLIIDLYKDINTEKFLELRKEAEELVRIFSKVKNNSKINS